MSLHTYMQITPNWNLREYFYEKDGYHNAHQNGSFDPHAFHIRGASISGDRHTVGYYDFGWEVM
jgi:hypothetical protein